MKEFNKLINKKEIGINRELFQKHFKFQIPIAMLKDLCNTDKKKNNELVIWLNVNWVSEDDVEIEKP